VSTLQDGYELDEVTFYELLLFDERFHHRDYM
jgi:hypothetical protein